MYEFILILKNIMSNDATKFVKVPPKILHGIMLVNPMSGITQQMQWEQAAADEEKMTWDARVFGLKPIKNDKVFVECKLTSTWAQKVSSWRFIRWFFVRFKYFIWLRKESQNYDVLLLRYSVADPIQCIFLKLVKIPVFLIHHTLEGPELKLQRGVAGGIKRLLDKLISPFSIRACYGLIGVTKEIVEYEKNRGKLGLNSPTFVYPNGVSLEAVAVPRDIDSEKSVPEILFIASYFFSWHGLDILLKNMILDTSEFVLHLVGVIPDDCLRLAQQDSRVIIHGQLRPSQIDVLSAKCRVGLSSFALERKGMREACTLKSREYLANGLAVYSGHKDVFPSEFPYYHMGIPNVRDILDFHNKLLGTKKLKIRTEAEKYISKKFLIRDLEEWIRKQLN